MRHRGWSRAMLGPVMIAGALALAIPAAQAQMCTPALKDCESQADADAQRCTFQCQRYDNICTDRCDDTHDTIVRYCWIKTALCKASRESQGFTKASGQHE